MQHLSFHTDLMPEGLAPEHRAHVPVEASRTRPAGLRPDEPPRPGGGVGPHGQFRPHRAQHTVVLHDTVRMPASGLSPMSRPDPMRLICEDAAAVAAQLPSLGGRTVLVSDSTGMLGTYILAIAEAAGARTIAVRRSGGALMLPSDPVDHIVHVGSLADPAGFRRDPVGAVTASTSLLAQLLEHARDHDADLTFVSAVDTARQLDLADPTSFYPAAVRAGEALCAAYREQYGVPSSILRLAQIYGPGFAEDDGQVWAEFTRAAVTGETVVVRSADSRRLAWTYVADAADAVLRTMVTTSQRDATVAFEAVDERSRCDIRAFAREALRSVGRPPALAYRLGAPDRTPDVPLLRPGIRPPGWKPRTRLSDGIGRTVRWYQTVLAVESTEPVAAS